jgi:hypothetical protein
MSAAVRADPGAEPAEPEVFVQLRAPGAVTYFGGIDDLADAITGEGGTVGHPMTSPVNGHPVGQCPECDGPAA